MTPAAAAEEVGTYRNGPLELALGGMVTGAVRSSATQASLPAAHDESSTLPCPSTLPSGFSALPPDAPGFDLQKIPTHISGSSLVKSLCSNLGAWSLYLDGCSIPPPPASDDRLMLRKPHRLSLRTKLRKMTRLKYLGRIWEENRVGSWMAKDFPEDDHRMMWL